MGIALGITVSKNNFGAEAGRYLQVILFNSQIIHTSVPFNPAAVHNRLNCVAFWRSRTRYGRHGSLGVNVSSSASL
jgi:hypothetical protein